MPTSLTSYGQRLTMDRRILESKARHDHPGYLGLPRECLESIREIRARAIYICAESTDNPVPGPANSRTRKLRNRLFGRASFKLSLVPARCLKDMPQFVTVRGGAYFFMPGIKALQFIASDPSEGG